MKRRTVCDLLGLYYYNARWYDPALSHFILADTIIPGAGNPQAWDRYAYVNNNPIRYSDPTGHIACDDVDENGKCINYEQLTHRAHKNLEKFVPPDKVEHNRMERACPIVCPELSPDEIDLLKGENKDVDLGTLWAMYEIEQKASNGAQELFPEETLWNGSGDAFRHAYWNALMTKEFGKDFALGFSTAHETQFSGTPNSKEAFMDLHNNSVGVEIAVLSPNASDEQLKMLVKVALNEGRLYVLDKNGIHLSNQVQGGGRLE